MTTTIFKRRFMTLLLAACFGAAVAAPTGQQVVAGQASFSQQGNVFSITNTPGTIINWQNFSINAGEITRFVQQGADSAVLNRIVGQDPSRIFGALQSNGKVFLINPNGIVFGRDARVDVNGLVASTLNLSNADFLAGKKNFSAGAAAGDIRNEGAISTPSGGQVYLLAPNVTNTGIITSPQGEVVLAAGRSVKLADSRDPDLHVVVSAPADRSINLGQVVAQGGRIGIYGALVSQRALVSADSALVGENGKIVFKASRAATLEQGSVTSATGAGTGGEVHLLGDRVALEGNAAVDASGALGGGTVLVGGGYQGKDASLPNASQTSMDKDARIKADATGSGNGGQVVLWSNGATVVGGSISARGGAQGGDGGKVETSGHDLNVNGIAVNASAAKGKAGSWLLDPYDIEVVETGANATLSDVASTFAGPGTGVSKIAPSLLAASGTDVVLQAQNDLTITDAITAGAGISGSAGHNININAPVTSNGGSVMFSAGSAINLNSAASIKSGNYIDLIADQMSLAGGIGGAGSMLPVVSLTTHSPGLGIQVGSGTASGGVLWLDAGALSRFSAYELNIGSSANTGGVSINAAINQSANLSVDSSGPIAVNAAVSLSGGSFLATLHGAQGTLLDINGAVTANSVYLTGDGLRISAPVTASTVKLMPHTPGTAITLGTLQEGKFSLNQDMLAKVYASDLTIGGLPGYYGVLGVDGVVDLSSHPFGKLTLDAGDGSVSIASAFKMPSGTLLLKSSQFVSETGGAITADKLAVTGGQVNLMGDNVINTVAGTANSDGFMLSTSGALSVGDAGGMSGIAAPTGSMVYLNSGGKLTLNRPVNAAGGSVSLEAAGVGGSETINASTLEIYSTAGIGSASAPLNTAVSAMRASSNQVGSQPVNIHNSGDLTLLAAYQSSTSNTDNSGTLSITTTGKMVIPAAPPPMVSSASANGSTASPGTQPGDGRVHTESGAVSLGAGSGMTIGGEVSSQSGNINLTVTSGSLTTQAGALITSSGDITANAGSTTFADGSFQAAPGKLHLPSVTPTPPPAPPTLDQCLADATINGCGTVLDTAKKQCAANPLGAHCGDLLPTVDVCKTNPNAIGCDTVLHEDEVKQCVAHPTGGTCGGTLNYCASNPSIPGCDALKQERGQLDACVANPKAAGCAAVLPTYDVCAATPDTYGCQPAVDEHNKIQACVADPGGPTCKDVLPTYATCSANPSTFGCVPVLAQHNKVQACMATPADPACASVLPALGVCTADPTVFGCSAVLDRQKFVACVANPAAPGCDAILPALDVCKANPAQEGCGAVISKTFDFCLASPNDARCVGVLPSLSQCVANPSAKGCQVVLPTMSQCIGSPTLQGCSVVLPTLNQCAANPNLQGCQAVLPKPDFCTSHPLDPTCQVFNPSPVTPGDSKPDNSSVQQAVQTTVTLINSSKTPTTTPVGTTGSGAATGTTAPTAGSGASNSDSSGDKPSDKSTDKQNGPAASENNGAKNEKPATKTYCN